jgi:hypothetical protein
VTRGSDRIPEHKIHVRLQLNLAYYKEIFLKCGNFYLQPLCRNSISEDGPCRCSRRFFLEINMQTSKILDLGREMERKGRSQEIDGVP